VPHHARGAAAARNPLLQPAAVAQATAAAAAAAAAAPAAAPPPKPAPAPGTRGPVYNVYAQVIDPLNNMPPPNQAPTPGQKVALSTDRVKSSIPKGGTDSTWLYPSPQMFWNSLHRKGKAEGVEETDVPTVVSIHNEMNERAWRQLLDWEKLHAREHREGEPALRHFSGNPYKLSPKAQLKARVLGAGFPFDRHDWFVDRAGEKRHYVIDYYYNPAGDALAPPDAPGTPSFDAGARLTRQIYVDVRPAVTDLSALADRLRLFPERFAAALRRPRFVAEGIDPSAPAHREAAAAAAAEGAAPVYSSAFHSEAARAAPAPPAPRPGEPDWAAIDAKCKPLLDALKAATNFDERRSRSVALTYGMGRILCPAEASSFIGELEAGEKAGRAGEAGGAEERAFEAMSRCVRTKAEGRGAGGAAPRLG